MVPSAAIYRFSIFWSFVPYFACWGDTLADLKVERYGQRTGNWIWNLLFLGHWLKSHLDINAQKSYLVSVHLLVDKGLHYKTGTPIGCHSGVSTESQLIHFA